MAGRKLSDLTTTTSLSENDLVYVVDVSAAAGSKSKGIAKSDLAALMGTTAAATQPVENEYADITALLADQGNQTTGFLQYVVDASADPNITSGEAYYEKLATSTATLADDYRLLSDTETEIIKDSNSYRVFRIQDIQDEGTPLTSVSGGKVSFEYSGANVTAILFNKLYTDAISEFYGKDVSIRFHNRATKRYETEAVASTAWTTVNTDYYRAEVTGTNIQIADLSANNRVEFFIVEAAATGGTFEYQTEITVNTTLDGTQKGLNKIYPVNSTTAKTITVTTGDYVANDVINIERRGQGSVEIIADTGVRIRGVRNSENRYFINDPNSIVALLCRGSEEFGIIGNLTRGYTGAVTTTSYGALREGDTAVDVTVIGTGFSSNMLVTVSANATQSSAFTFVSATEITLHLTAVGVETNTVTVTYDNGDEFVDTDAITIAAAGATYTDYTSWFKFDETSGTVVTDETGNFNGTNNGTTNINNTGKVVKSYIFNGTDNYISGLGTLGITSFPATINLWVKITSVTGLYQIINNNSSTLYKGIRLYALNGTITVQFGDGTGIATSDRKNYTTDSVVLSDATWHNISVKVTDINTVSIKVDNATAANSFVDGTATTVDFSQDYQIARKSNSSDAYFAFEIDELKTWNRLLTDTEETDIYTLENAGSPML